MTPDFNQLPSTGRQGWGGSESQVMARFYQSQKPDNFQSQQQGRPVSKPVDMVEIRQFGERDSTIHEVTETDKQRFPRAWDAFTKGRESIQDGTPLSALFPANPEVVKELQGWHIWTVQALANAPDSTTGIPFLVDWKKRAREYLDGLEKGKGFHEANARAEAAELKAMQLEEDMKAMMGRLSALEAEKKSTKPPKE